MKRKRIAILLSVATMLVGSSTLVFAGSNSGTFTGGSGNISCYTTNASANTSVGNGTAYVWVQCMAAPIAGGATIKGNVGENTGAGYVTSYSKISSSAYRVYTATSKHGKYPNKNQLTLTATP